MTPADLCLLGLGVIVLLAAVTFWNSEQQRTTNLDAFKLDYEEIRPKKLNIFKRNVTKNKEK